LDFQPFSQLDGVVFKSSNTQCSKFEIPLKLTSIEINPNKIKINFKINHQTAPNHYIITSNKDIKTELTTQEMSVRPIKNVLLKAIFFFQETMESHESNSRAKGKIEFECRKEVNSFQPWQKRENTKKKKKSEKVAVQEVEKAVACM
jgi:hypothetical protein